MGNQLYKNNATGTLNGSIAIGATTLNLAAGQGSRFPTPTGGDYFLLTIFEKSGGGLEITYEVVACTARTADSLTITRDFEGLVVAAGGTSGGWGYPSAVGINPSGVVYVEMRATAYLFGNTVTKDMKDKSGGVPGLTLFKLNLRNALDTITSFFTTAATVARTWTMPDKDGTVAMASDVHDATAKGTPVDADEIGLMDSAASWVVKKSTLANLKTVLLSAWKDTTGGLVGMTLFSINFKNVANTFTSFFTNTNTAARTYTFQDKDGTVAHSSDVHDASVKTPVGADEIGLMDSAASWVVKKVTLNNFIVYLRTVLDGVYAIGSGRLAPNFVNSGALVAQRAGTTINLSTSRQIGQVDNVAIWASGGAVSAGTLTQVTSAISGTTGYAARAAGVTLTGSGVISHAIMMESRDAVAYKNKTVSFSVKVDHDVGSNINYTLVVKKPTVADVFGTLTTIATSSTTSVPTASGTTVVFNAVSVGDCTNGLVFEVQAACGAVTTKNFNCDEFSADINATAQTYAAESFYDALDRCQRHVTKSYSYATAPGTATVVSSLYSTATGTIVAIPIQFPVPMFAVPTMTYYSTTGASGKFRNVGAGADFNATDGGGLTGTSRSVAYNATSGATVNQEIGGHYLAVAEML